MTHDLYLRFPEGKAKALTFSYDDGVQQDIRLKALLDKYALRATFNLNSGLFSPEGATWPQGAYMRRMTSRQVLETFADGRHEVGLHALTHAYLEQMPPARITHELLMDRLALEGLFKTLVRGGAYPYGTLSDEVVACLRACGVAYFRTTQASHSLEVPLDWLRLSPTCHHADPALPALCEQFLTDPVERRPALLYIWGHSYEFERDGNWPMMEALCARLAGHADVFYATNIQLYDYVQAFHALRMSCDGRLLENPSAQDIWFTHRGETGCVRGGQRLWVD